MMSLWSPKIESAWHATARAVTWNTVGVNSPAILNMFGIISKSPWDAVNVVVKAPVASAPCTAPAAPASDCISVTLGIVPQMFFSPLEDFSSAISPRPEEGVIGYIAMTSLYCVRHMRACGIAVMGLHFSLCHFSTPLKCAENKSK